MKRVIVVSLDTDEYTKLHKAIARALNRYAPTWEIQLNIPDDGIKALFEKGLIPPSYLPTEAA